MIARVLALPFTALVGLVGLLVTGPVAPAAAAPVQVYSYDGHHHPGVLAHTASERGPPASYDDCTRDAADDSGWRGASARPKQGAAGSTTTHTTPAGSAQFTESTATTAGPTWLLGGPSIAADTCRVAANAGPRALPASVKVPLGNSKYGLEHILRRHSFNSLTTKPASKFSRGMGHIEIRQAINDAVARGGTWRVEGSSRVLDTGLGRTIGTDLAGNPTSGIRVVTDETGSVITSYRIPWP